MFRKKIGIKSKEKPRKLPIKKKLIINIIDLFSLALTDYYAINLLAFVRFRYRKLICI